MLRSQRGHRIGRGADERQVGRAAARGGQPAQVQRPVQDVLGHVPVFGEFPADDADHAARRLHHRVLSGDIGRAAFAGVDQRPQPGVGALARPQWSDRWPGRC